MADRFALFVRDDEACKKATTRARLALYALAARADEKGYCWPSVEQLQEDTGMSRASVFRALTEIRGILTVDAPGYKKSNSYIFPYQEKAEVAIERKKGKLSTEGEEAVDKSLKLRRKQSQIETGSLKLRREGSQIETGGGLKLRPEEYIRRIQEDSLSLTLSQNGSKAGAAVDNSAKRRVAGGAVTGKTCTGDEGYDGTRKPRTKAEIAKIEKWCKMAGLDDFRTKDFIRINRLARWSRVEGETTVCDLIADFLLKWQKEDPEGYCYYTDKRKGIRRG